MAAAASTFRDRRHAGAVLADAMRDRHPAGAVVLGLPRGGVPVAYEIATSLGLELDVFVVRKLGVPWHPELAMGAIAGGGTIFLNYDVVAGEGVSDEELNEVIARESDELQRRERAYRGDLPPLDLSGRPALLVDDGLATGASMRAAVAALRTVAPASVTIALPIAPPETCDALRAEVDEVVCAVTPAPFFAVGFWYEDFSETGDAEVRDLLQRARSRTA